MASDQGLHYLLIECSIRILIKMTSTWSTCSVSCTPASGSVTGGTWTRTRNCSDPEPKYDGQQCDGDSVETDSCTIATTCPGTVSPVLFNPIKPNEPRY